MNEIDALEDAIRRTLSTEDAQLLKRLSEDPSFHRQVLATLQGQHRWINALGWISGLALFAVACYFWWRFAYAQEVRHMLLWAACAAVAILGLALVKVWFWLELQKNAIVREVKRLELQVASLAARMRV